MARSQSCLLLLSVSRMWRHLSRPRRHFQLSQPPGALPPWLAVCVGDKSATPEPSSASCVIAGHRGAFPLPIWLAWGARGDRADIHCNQVKGNIPSPTLSFSLLEKWGSHYHSTVYICLLYLELRENVFHFTLNYTGTQLWHGKHPAYACNSNTG